MRGRYGAIYGTDALNKFLLALFILEFIVFKFIVPFKGADVIALIIVIIIYYRMLSKDLNKRIAENRKFLSLTSSIRRPVKRIGNNISDKEYKYIECPNCKQELRVPKKKGKIKVTCKKCHTKFETRT